MPRVRDAVGRRSDDRHHSLVSKTAGMLAEVPQIWARHLLCEFLCAPETPENARAHRKMSSLTPGIGYSITSSLTSGIGHRWRTAFEFPMERYRAQNRLDLYGRPSLALPQTPADKSNQAGCTHSLRKRLARGAKAVPQISATLPISRQYVKWRHDVPLIRCQLAFCALARISSTTAVLASA